MNDRRTETMPRPASTRALALATLAFAACFFAWSLLGPLGPELQDHLGLSDVSLAVLVAVPVLLGSLMRIPLGLLAERHGGRRVFGALLALTPLPLMGLAVWHDSFAGVVALGFVLGFAGASFAVGVPFVNRWFAPERQGAALGVYGMGMAGSVVAGFTGPKIVTA
jgi:MFS transporter, NNP family, nitrate/nitrite transporter